MGKNRPSTLPKKRIVCPRDCPPNFPGNLFLLSTPFRACLAFAFSCCRRVELRQVQLSRDGPGRLPLRLQPVDHPREEPVPRPQRLAARRQVRCAVRAPPLGSTKLQVSAQPLYLLCRRVAVEICCCTLTQKADQSLGGVPVLFCTLLYPLG